MDAILKPWADRIRSAASDRLPLQIRGGGSKDFYGNIPHGQLFDTRVYRGIVSYEPTELVITARCGTPLAEIEAALAEKNQVLAFEPPHFSDTQAGGNATLGGCVAAGLSGPRRLQVGPLRDFVLGTRLLDGQGRVMDFGGQVMKNVAGYDISRLLAGSLGVLGVIAEVSLKVLPKPMAEATLRLEVDEARALQLMNQWRGQPLPISATAWHQDVLSVRLSGARAAVEAASRQLGGSAVDDPQAQLFWSDLREQRLAFFSNSDIPLWRLSLPANCAPLDLGDTLIEWSGGLRWLRCDLAPEIIRATAKELGGNATLFRCNKTAAAFTPLPDSLMLLHRRLKQQFDPAGIFNPGRLYPDL